MASSDSNDGAKPEAVNVGADLPPVPSKLVKKIRAWEYIEISELLPDHLGHNMGLVASSS